MTTPDSWRSRPQAPLVGEEREQLLGWLAYHRATLLDKVDGLDEDALRSSPVPSGTSLLGLLAHLAAVEAWWFRVVLDDDVDVALPWSEEDPDAEWRVEPGKPASEVIDAYREACARSDEALARYALDDEVVLEGDPVTTRWIVIHMIEETARHNGHADILRELIDGAVGE
jgi:uncharacterized damage-inducible protein DinB